MVERDPEPTRTLVEPSETSELDESAKTRTRTRPEAAPPGKRLEKLGRFEILRELGRGGMGRVFKAWDPARGEQVAVKLLLGFNSSSFYRFKREFRGLAEVSHPNLVKLHELFYEDGRMFFSMELLDGTDFVEALHSHGRTDYEALRDALRQLVQGVNALHRVGKLHRDIKPPNIMVTSRGRVVLLDFGLIRERDEADDADMTAPGAVLGTPAYMSPEQASGFEIGPASDWYAVGLVLFEAAAGRRPFIEKSPARMMQVRLVDDAPTLRSIVQDVPEDLSDLCASLLQRQPDDRPEPSRLLALVGADPSDSGLSERADTSGFFVGRATELGALREALARVCHGAPSCVFVHGPSGIGKTQLIQQFLTQAEDSYGMVLAGRCYERESMPYNAFDSIVDAIAGRLRELENRDRDTIMPPGMSALARLFPTLGRVAHTSHHDPEWGTVADDHEIRAQAFAALKDLLNHLALDGTLVVTIDDLQWCDMDSVALLLEILRPPDAPAMLLLASHRSQQIESNPALHALLQAANSASHPMEIEDIELGPLEPEECLALAGALLERGDSAVGEQARAIAHECDGSPFFVSELVRHAQTAGTELVPEDGSALSLEGLIARRIKALPNDARQVLRTISVAGHRIEQGVVLQAAAGRRLDRSALDSLRSEKLIRSEGVNDRDWVEPFHDRIRDCIVNALDADSLRSAHLDLAEALAESGRADPTVLATHFASAGAGERTVVHALGAAEAAAEALAFMRAVEWLEVALARIAEADPRRPSIETSLARAYGSAGHAYEAAQAYTRAAEASDEADRPALYQRAAFLLASAGNLGEARRLLDDLFGRVGLRLPSSPARALASLLWLRSRIAFRGLEYEEHTIDEVSPETLHRIDLCWAAGYLVPYERIVGGGFIARHLLLALEAGEPSRIAPALAMEAVARFMRGNADRGETQELVRRAEEVADRSGSQEARAWVANVKPPISLFMGNWGQAMTQARDAADLLRRHASAAGVAVMTNRYLELWAKVQTGDWTELEAPLRQLLRSGGRANALHWGIRGLLAMPVALARDLPDEAIREFETYRASPPADVYGSNQITMFSGTICAYLYVDNVDEAWAFAQERRAPLERTLRISDSLSRCVYQNGRSQAALAYARKHGAPRAARAAKAALRRLERSGLAMASALANLGLAALADMNGDARGAERLCRECVDGFDALDMRVHAAVSRHRLGELIGGDRGRHLEREAAQALRDSGVQQPSRLVAALSGGFPSS